jgi:hypothetical protein
MERSLGFFHSMLAFSIQKRGSRRLPQHVISSASRSWRPISKQLVDVVFVEMANQLVAPDVHNSLATTVLR